jgi:hypothetical protein
MLEKSNIDLLFPSRHSASMQLHYSINIAFNSIEIVNKLLSSSVMIWARIDAGRMSPTPGRSFLRHCAGKRTTPANLCRMNWSFFSSRSKGNTICIMAKRLLSFQRQVSYVLKRIFAFRRVHLAA